MSLSRARLALLLANLTVLTLALILLARPATPTVQNRLLTDAPLAAPGEWFESQRVTGGELSRRAYEHALDEARVLAERTASERPELAEATWTHMGPANFGGRVNEVAVDPTRGPVVGGSVVSSDVYAATASGGVWKSTNAGETWDYAWDQTITQATGAVAVGGDGTVYVGTGEANPGGGSITYGGTGLYRSTDAGATWERVGLETSGAFGRIVVDPSDPQRVFAAASGNLFVPGGERGLYRSDDGGDTWKRVLAGDNGTTGAVDVAIDPQNPDNLLATMWDHIRHATHRVYAGPGSGVYRSTDGGESWTRVELPGNVPADEVGRIGVAFAPSDPQRAYAIVSNRMDGTGVGVWRSSDGGATWSKTAVAGGQLQQSVFGWWFGKIWVDPAMADRVFVAGVELMESVDGGDRFVAHSQTLVGVLTGAFQAGPALHADQHGMAWDPNTPGRVYVANDGGMYRSDTNAALGSWVAAKRQGWTQHYSVDVGEQTPDYVITGLQDNLCQRNSPGTPGGNEMTWQKVGICGDGLQTLINPVDETWTYTCSQYGYCGVQRAGVPHPGRPGQLVGSRPPGQRYGWMTPLEFDPNDPSVMYFASDIVSRSTDNGLTWTPISDDLTGNPEQLDPHNGYRIYGTITALAVSASDPQTIVVGTDTGKVWITRDGGQKWTELGWDAEGQRVLPEVWVTSVAIDPDDAAAVYVTYSGFRNGRDEPLVLRSADGGASWDNISGNLPDAPVNRIEIIGDRLAVATDVGVLLSDDDGASWYTLGANLPAVPVTDLRYHAGTGTLTAATFGHGIQRVALP